jgi:hypothetical protein
MDKIFGWVLQPNRDRKRASDQSNRAVGLAIGHLDGLRSSIWWLWAEADEAYFEVCWFLSHTEVCLHKFGNWQAEAER